MKTYIINETTQTFQLKEGNAGAFRSLGELETGHKNSKFTIRVDPNATYREYMVATGEKGKTIIITSDDFSEYEVIRIIKVDPPAGSSPGTPVTYKSVPSKPRKQSGQGTDECQDAPPYAPSNAGDGSSPASSSNAGAGGSVPVVSSSGGESAPGDPSNTDPGESIPRVSSNRGPAQPASEGLLNAGPVESAPRGSLTTGPTESAPGGANHVAWYKKYFKSSRS